VSGVLGVQQGIAYPGFSVRALRAIVKQCRSAIKAKRGAVGQAHSQHCAGTALCCGVSKGACWPVHYPMHSTVNYQARLLRAGEVPTAQLLRVQVTLNGNVCTVLRTPVASQPAAKPATGSR